MVVEPRLTAWPNRTLFRHRTWNGYVETATNRFVTGLVAFVLACGVVVILVKGLFW